MHKTITVKINALGMPTVEANGFQGGSCTDATKAIEKALSPSNEGNTETEFKSSFYESEEAQTISNDVYGGY
jgi:hypothetical protein